MTVLSLDMWVAILAILKETGLKLLCSYEKDAKKQEIMSQQRLNTLVFPHSFRFMGLSSMFSCSLSELTQVIPSM